MITPAKVVKKGNQTSVDEVISELPPAEQVIVKKLRALILDALPNVIEKNSDGVPFYTHHRMMLFIWPPSVCWDSRKTEMNNKGVTLGFCQGNLMSNDDGALLQEGRKQVFCMYFRHVNEINDKKLLPLFYEADLIDQQFKKVKSGKSRSAKKPRR